MKIVVIGGTGLIGSRVVRYLNKDGHEAIAASPSTGVNALTGQGLAEVLKGAQVIVDVSQAPSFDEPAAMNFFRTATGNILKCGTAAGVGHLAALSVVGTDRLPESPYFRAKLAQEKLIKESGLPYSIIRAPQFFEFVKSIADFSTQGNQVHVAPVLFQPMAADDVAKAVARVAAGKPVNGIVEVGGPETFRLDQLMRHLLAELGDSREVVSDPDAPYSGARLSERTLVAGDGAPLGEIRFDDWLAQQKVSK